TDTDPKTGYLNVTGTATFDAGSAVQVSAKPFDFIPTQEGVEYVLVKAGSIADSGVSVSSSSYLLNVKQFTVDGTIVKAVVQAKADDEIGDIEDPEGGTDVGGDNGGSPHGNDSIFNGSTGAILVMKNSILGQLQPTDPVFQALSNAQTREEVLKIAKQLTPEVNGGSTVAALSGQSIVGGAVSNRVSSLRTGLSSGDVLKETGVWAQALSNNSDQNKRGGVDGFQSNSGGIAIGADGKLSDRITIGAALSYLNTNVTSDSGDKTEVQGSAFTLYGSYEMGNWFVDGSVTA
ncbi:autotransporter outer membrane beta-barrel domain-containing protein, partial [Pseudomonas sp. NPDC078863]